MVVWVQFPSDRQPRPTTEWCWLLAAAAALGLSREWAGAARGRGGGWGNAPPLPGLMKLTFLLSCSQHYPAYSLNVASMWLKLGRLHMALENRPAGVKALKRVSPAFFVNNTGLGMESLKHDVLL